MDSKTIIYKGVEEGDWVKCSQCGKMMLLPYGADQCPECYGWGTLDWVDEEKQETDIDSVGETEYTNRKLKLEDYLDPETLAIEYPDYYRELKKENNLDW